MGAETDCSAVADSVYREFVEDERREKAQQHMEELQEEIARLRAEVEGLRKDTERLNYIEKTFSGMTNRERYMPVTMIWGAGAMGRTLRQAVDKYMDREAGEGASA